MNISIVVDIELYYDRNNKNERVEKIKARYKELVQDKARINEEFGLFKVLGVDSADTVSMSRRETRLTITLIGTQDIDVRDAGAVLKNLVNWVTTKLLPYGVEEYLNVDLFLDGKYCIRYDKYRWHLYRY